MEYVSQQTVTEKAEMSQDEIQLLPLSELQLALVGGGVGEVVFG